MRIGISAEWLGTQAGGLETYSRKLIEALPLVSDDDEFVVYTARRDELTNLPGVGRNIHVRYLGTQSRWLAIPFGLPLGLLRSRVDLFHATSIAPPWCPAPLVVTVHDLGFLRHPEFFPPLVRLRLARLVGSGARRARRVIAVSEATRADLIEHYRLPPSRISVVSEGVDPIYRPIADVEATAQVRRQLGLPERYVLYVGRLHVRKNLVRLLEAFASLRGPATAGLGLVLAGRKLYDDEPLSRAIRDFGLHDRVFLPGHVADAQMPYVYSGAEVFVYPSLFEGFGLPPLEAMACGVPVVAANASSVPEVVGEAALLVNPRDVGDIAAKLRALLESPELRANHRALGIARARQFTWDRAARETLAVYREALLDSDPHGQRVSTPGSA